MVSGRPVFVILSSYSPAMLGIVAHCGGYMSYYRHTQVGTLILGMLGADMLLIVAILLVGGRAAPLLVVLAILVVSAVLFAALTVEIQGGDLTLRFGRGLIRKRVPLATIRSCAVVRNPWWYSWGI